MNKIKTITLSIEGMTCASCVARVEKAISKAQGVKNASVNLSTEKATLHIDEEKFDFLEVKKLIEEAGYEVKRNLDELDKNLFHHQTSEFLQEARNDFITSLLFTVPVFVLNMTTMSDTLTKTLNVEYTSINQILFILTSLLIIISGRKFYIKFIKNLTHLNFDMNSLISIGTGSAFLFSSFVTFLPFYLPDYLHNHVYFDTTAVIISLVLLGKWLEAKAKFKTNEAINELIKIQPQKALVKIGEREFEKDIEELNINDIVIIKPGQNVPTDGIVVNGFSTFDESIITGESLPVEKTIGSKVKSGAVNKTGYIEYRVTATAANSTLGQIIKLMEESPGVKAPIQKTADKISSIFVPIVMLVALASFMYWFLVTDQLDAALINFISVLIIACPCALGLAIPTAIVVGIGSAAKRGILIRDGSSLENFHKVKTIFFDKTGTVTNRKLFVESYKIFNMDIEQLLEYVIPAEQKSEHPIAQAIVDFSKQFNLKLRNLEEFESKTGLGIKAIVDGRDVIVGNKNFINEHLPKQKKISHELDNSHSEVYVVIDGELVAIFSISEEIKPEAVIVIKSLSDSGVKTFLLSGDKLSSTKKIAERCGVTAFESGLLPADKFEIIKNFQSRGEIVAFVGDGVNDAPAITQADIGIAMGGGTDIAILSGDVIILNDNLENLLAFKKISQKVNSIIKQNLFWAFIYNVIGIPLAAIGMLNPIFAALAMSMSSVSVITNSLRLKKGSTF
jgi:Cu+-exporting ATPase